MLLKPVVFQCLDFPAGLSAVDKVAAFGLQKAFFDMTCQGLPFLVGPAFLGFLSFEGTAEYVFDVCISITGKPFVNQRLKVGGHIELHRGSPSWSPAYRDTAGAASGDAKALIRNRDPSKDSGWSL